MLKSLWGPQKRVVLLDWSNVVWRAISVASEPEEFLQLLLKMVANYRKLFSSFAWVVALEGSGVEVRRRLWPAYKAQRVHHEEAGELMRLAEQVLGCLESTVIRAPRGEADDAIASYLDRHVGQNDRAIVVSEDRDLWACIRDPAIEVHSTRLGARLSAAWVQNQLGVPPAKITLLKALLGDASDNLPKVPQLTQRSAIRLANEAAGLKQLWPLLRASWLGTRERNAFVGCKTQVRVNYRTCKLQRRLKLVEKVQRAKPKRLRKLLIENNIFGTPAELLQHITKGA